MEITNNIITIIASVLTLFTACLGLYETVKPDRFPSVSKYAWVMFIFGGLFIAATSVWVYELNRKPIGYIKTVLVDVDSSGNYDFEQTQSYYLPWSIQETKDAELLLRVASKKPEGLPPSFSQYVVTSSNYSFSSPQTTLVTKANFDQGGQFHFIAKGKRTFGESDKEEQNKGWWYCPGWTGLNYKNTKLQRNSQLVFTLDFRGVSKDGSCAEIFKNNGQPRILWINDKIRDKYTGGAKPAYCQNELSRMKVIDHPQQCLWYAKIDDTEGGEITVRWSPKDSISASSQE